MVQHNGCGCRGNYCRMLHPKEEEKSYQDLPKLGQESHGLNRNSSTNETNKGAKGLKITMRLNDSIQTKLFSHNKQTPNK